MKEGHQGRKEGGKEGRNDLLAGEESDIIVVQVVRQLLKHFSRNIKTVRTITVRIIKTERTISVRNIKTVRTISVGSIEQYERFQ